MSGLTLLLFVVVSWIFVYLQVQGIWFRHWIGSGISFLPAFIVYTAWAQPVWVATCITILSSLWLDALSNQPLGLSLKAAYVHHGPSADASLASYRENALTCLLGHRRTAC